MLNRCVAAPPGWGKPARVHEQLLAQAEASQTPSVQQSTGKGDFNGTHHVDVRKFIHSGYLGGWEFRDDMFFLVFGSIFWSAKRSLFPLTDTSGPQKTHIAMRTQPSSTFLTSATRARKLFERSSEPTLLSCLPKSGIKKQTRNWHENGGVNYI